MVERPLAWKNQLGRVRVRDERRDDVHFGFLVLSRCLMLLRRLYPDFCWRFLVLPGHLNRGGGHDLRSG
ncbi:hypothetical protein FJV41_34895 [Myxococcus llanfairpwllgwyngyllgogerychwyrndrobwllllantysiliogogogochensis]|uniref:Uncharacterized protein n=1 Tax=Myxococcus llanfairpwllgwyngyllgogerychwyrndrobwllllantysiliogogogochensis TaxID=2590453 RepID=A0A540WQN4_9BACT|nr:hypothetical protein FJV41_34895 [Myxococcus llanfairpwllgwyngyllgogerychwyrndrobwllllantysiliogogogochensis]